MTIISHNKPSITLRSGKIINLKVIREGSIQFLVPASSPSEDGVLRKNEFVFYNEKQSFNRDFSVLYLKAWKMREKRESIRALETLAGTGIRAFRYLNEVPIDEIIINDLNPNAYQLVLKNLNHSTLTYQFNKQKIRTMNLEANNLFHRLSASGERFEVIDIDPFGTPIPYIYNSLSCLLRNGTLCLTTTDLPVLVGHYPEKAYKLYGLDKSFKTTYCHESALRGFIAGIQRIGAMCGTGLIPTLAFSVDHYLRVCFVRTRNFSRIWEETGYIGQCKLCKKSFKIPMKNNALSVCSCGEKISLYGPAYLGKLCNDEILNLMALIVKSDNKVNLHNHRRIDKFLSFLRSENSISIPWYYDLHRLSKGKKGKVPQTVIFVELLISRGYKASRTHYSGSGIKTDAPISEIHQLIDEQLGEN